MRILYAEDNPANLLLVQRIARSGGHEIINYASGAEILKNFERDNPDLVLMDVQLEGAMTGLDVVRVLRTAGYTTPIYAVTAYAMVGDKEKCLDAGCTGYMAKPLPVMQLVELFNEINAKVKNASVENQPSAPPMVPAPSAVASPKAEAAPPTVSGSAPAILPAAAPVVQTAASGDLATAPERQTHPLHSALAGERLIEDDEAETVPVRVVTVLGEAQASSRVESLPASLQTEAQAPETETPKKEPSLPSPAAEVSTAQGITQAVPPQTAAISAAADDLPTTEGQKS